MSLFQPGQLGLYKQQARLAGQAKFDFAFIADSLHRTQGELE